MDEGGSSDGGFWHTLSSIFRLKHGPSLEDSIQDALEDGEVKSDDVRMLLNILNLDDKLVHEIMIPRTDIVCADLADGTDEVIRLIIERGHSRIPIYENDKDNIIGIVHAKDLLRSMHPSCHEPPELKTVMRQPMFIPENKNVRDMLQEFRRSKIHLAVAVDEYGGTSGLVTLEDVLEEIVGEIEDEHDAKRPEEIKHVGDGTTLISGRVEIDDLNKEFDLDISSEQVETIGGYLSELSGHVPREKEKFSFSGMRFTVIEADQKQVRWIRIEPDPQPKTVEAES
ncbi:MAG: hemolysin family protein [Desulfovibrio sp.]|uniref:hemolysin family protein n=1 Tax=Desulfovibrio sp. 7SRBS1 TaxID=3378064 RepID=UPI003B40BD6A